MSLFQIPNISIKNLTHSLNVFHGLFKENKCQSSLLEELFSRALDADPKYENKVEWNSGSHDPGADIKLPDVTISVKSGNIRTIKETEKDITYDVIEISGNRLTKAKGDFDKINELLNSYISDVVICFVYNDKNETYQIIYIDKEVFIYPDSSSKWNGVYSAKTNKISRYEWEAPNKMFVSITPNMSWQAWWRIPLKICRYGKIIDLNNEKKK